MIKPKENLEYTFIYPGGKTYTFVYRGFNQKGRYVFENVLTKSMTSMSPDRFSYLHRHNLRAEVPREGYETEKKVQQTEIFIDEIKKAEKESESETERRIIQELRSLSDVDRARVYFRIGKTPEKLADELEEIKLFNITDPTKINVVFSQMIAARDCYL